MIKTLNSHLTRDLDQARTCTSAPLRMSLMISPGQAGALPSGGIGHVLAGTTTIAVRRSARLHRDNARGA